MRAIIREQRHICGAHYAEVDIYGVTPAEHSASRRAKKQAATRLVQKNLNDKNAKRYLTQLLATNFTCQDIHMTLTYDEGHLPENEDAAEKDLSRWLRKVRERCKRKKLDAVKYIAVTEWQEEEKEKRAVRFHHHVVIHCELCRDELEQLWTVPKSGEKLGLCNADRLQAEKGSYEALAAYITKYHNRRHRWKRSRGLAEPVRPAPNDSRYSRKALNRIAAGEELHDKAFWERRYPGYFFGKANANWDEYNGWHITVCLWKPEDAKNEMQTMRKRI